MERRIVVTGLAAMLAFLALSAWLDLSGWFDQESTDQSSTTPTATPTVPKATERPAVDKQLVEQNRSERKGPSWSPADPVGPDGKPLTLGNAVPGAFQPIKAGTNIQEAVAAGYMERDPKREQACEGTFWKWTGQLSGGLDVLVGADKTISSLGMRKDGLETPEGISIGNSFGALTKTYGDRLQGPERMDYGQAGAFLRDGNDWIGFLFDNEPGRLADNSHIVFIEVSHGKRPGLLRDGC